MNWRGWAFLNLIRPMVRAKTQQPFDSHHLAAISAALQCCLLGDVFAQANDEPSILLIAQLRPTRQLVEPNPIVG
jgi:hypothetical protein